MKNILEEIAARTTERIAKEKAQVSISELENRIQEINKTASQKMTFLQALQKDGIFHIWRSRRNMNRQVQAQSPASQSLSISRDPTST